MATKAKKTAKKNTTIDFSNSTEKIKGTARTINNEVLTTATEVLEDLRTNGEKVREMATESVNAAIETVKNVKVEDGVKFVKETATSINKFGLETAESALDSAVATGKEWQGVARKAVNSGLELADKQQEIVFDTLDAVKEQMTEGAKRFRGLFANN
ncbi:MAG: hypothetical protein AAGH79_01655 [Bacteroidota bacterium]